MRFLHFRRRELHIITVDFSQDSIIADRCIKFHTFKGELYGIGKPFPVMDVLGLVDRDDTADMRRIRVGKLLFQNLGFEELLVSAQQQVGTCPQFLGHVFRMQPFVKPHPVALEIHDLSAGFQQFFAPGRIVRDSEQREDVYGHAVFLQGAALGLIVDNDSPSVRYF